MHEDETSQHAEDTSKSLICEIRKSHSKKHNKLPSLMDTILYSLIQLLNNIRHADVIPTVWSILTILLLHKREDKKLITISLEYSIFFQILLVDSVSMKNTNRICSNFPNAD